MSGQRQAPATLYPREWAIGSLWLGVWVGLITGPDIEARGKYFASAVDRTPVVQTVVRHYTE
jgi:hypothetical protein